VRRELRSSTYATSGKRGISSLAVRAEDIQ
jgi:hypothetical protein